MLKSPQSQFFKRFTLAAAALLTVLGPGIASATLGEPEISVQSDGAKMQGSIKVQQRSVYRVHEIQLNSGTLVREFVSPDGTVFAVAWHGQFVPDLRQTLGKYFDTFVSGARVKAAGHTHVDIQQDDVVIQTGGHMRAFSGRAFIPSAVPAGVSVGDLH